MSAKRWSSYDTDTYRLPNGLTRVGYDSDSQKYTFRDSSGQEYTSASGSAYGPLEKGGIPLTLTHTLSHERPWRLTCSFLQVPAGWDGGPLCSPRSARTGSASSASSAGVKGPATDFSEILGDMDEEHVDEKDKPKEKGPPMAFSVLVSCCSMHQSSAFD